MVSASSAAVSLAVLALLDALVEPAAFFPRPRAVLTALVAADISTLHRDGGCGHGRLGCGEFLGLPGLAAGLADSQGSEDLLLDLSGQLRDCP